MATEVCVGIDLATRRASDLGCLNLPGTHLDLAQAGSDDEIVVRLAEWGTTVVAIDAPLGLPAGLCCLEESHPCIPHHPGPGRSGERELARRGIPCFWTTKRTIIKSLVYRGIALRARLVELGYTVLEVYPYATKRILLGPGLPSKHRPEGRARLVEGIRGLLPDLLLPADWSPTHDALDAVYCAITARCYQAGAAECLGATDEVSLVIPVPPR